MNERERRENRQADDVAKMGQYGAETLLGEIPVLGPLYGLSKAAYHLGAAGIDDIAGDRRGAREHLVDAGFEAVGALPVPGLGPMLGAGEMAHDLDRAPGAPTLKERLAGNESDVRYEKAERIPTRRVVTPQMELDMVEHELFRTELVGAGSPEQIQAMKEKVHELRKRTGQLEPRPEQNRAQKIAGKERAYLARLEEGAEEGDPAAILALRERREYDAAEQLFREGKGPEPPLSLKEPSIEHARQKLTTAEGQLAMASELHLRMAEKMAAGGVPPETVANILQLSEDLGAKASEAAKQR